MLFRSDVIPLDGADVFQQGEIDSIGDWVALTQAPGDFARLPVDDVRQGSRSRRGVLAFYIASCEAPWLDQRLCPARDAHALG